MVREKVEKLYEIAKRLIFLSGEIEHINASNLHYLHDAYKKSFKVKIKLKKASERIKNVAAGKLRMESDILIGTLNIIVKKLLKEFGEEAEALTIAESEKEELMYVIAIITECVSLIEGAIKDMRGYIELPQKFEQFKEKLIKVITDIKPLIPQQTELDELTENISILMNKLSKKVSADMLKKIDEILTGANTLLAKRRANRLANREEI